MQFKKELVGEEHNDQLMLYVKLDLPCTIKVVCRSVSRNDTGYEIWDQNGDFMGSRSLTYNRTGLNHALVEDLNILLEEFDVQLEADDFLSVFTPAFHKCESRYGMDHTDGDAVIHLQ